MCERGTFGFFGFAQVPCRLAQGKPRDLALMAADQLCRYYLVVPVPLKRIRVEFKKAALGEGIKVLEQQGIEFRGGHRFHC